MKYFYIASDVTPGKGGIQTWGHYIIQFLKYNKLVFDCFTFQDIPKKLFLLLRINFLHRFFILHDWNKSAFVIISILLNKFRITKCSYSIMIYGDEILNLRFIKKTILMFLTKNKHIYFIAISYATADIFRKVTNRKVDLICPPFVDILSKRKLKKSINFSKKKGEKILFSITRLAKRKNIINVIKALHRLKNMNKFVFQYYIAGKGPDYETIQNLIYNLKMEKEVHLLGFVSEEEKDFYLQNADLFLLPSFFDKTGGSIEGYGIVFIEANKWGKPVISGNTGGMKEAVIDGVTGFHCNGSVNDIADKILLALKTRFSKKKITEHAEKHDYRLQKDLLNFLSSH